MNISKLVICLFALNLLTACGGGSSAPPPATDPVIDTSTEAVEQQIADTEQELETFETELVTTQPGAPSVNLTGTWISLWSARTNFILSHQNQSTSGEGAHEGLVVLHIVDNGPTLTVNYCGAPETTWTLDFIDGTQVHNPADTSNLYVGTVENSSVIEFPTVTTSSSSTNGTGDTLAEQGYTKEVLIKLSDQINDTIAYLDDSDAVASEDLNCVHYGSRNYRGPEFAGADRFLNYENDSLSAQWTLDESTQVWRENNELIVQVGERIYRVGLY